MVVEGAVIPSLFAGWIDDAAMFPPGNAAAPDAVQAHERYRQSWFAPLVGPLVVRDRELPQVADAVRATTGGTTDVTVSVIVTGRTVGPEVRVGDGIAGVEVVAVEIPLQDPDDLAGEASRVVSAGELLADRAAVFVEFPFLPGWEVAADTVRAAGRFGKIRTGGPDPADTPPSVQLARQLAVLVGADLPFKATAGLHHAVATPGTDPDRPRRHGFLNLLVAVAVLTDGASESDAVRLLGCTESEVLLSELSAWRSSDVARVRRLFRSFGCCGVPDPVTDLVDLGLLAEPV